MLKATKLGIPRSHFTFKSFLKRLQDACPEKHADDSKQHAEKQEKPRFLMWSRKLEHCMPSNHIGSHDVKK